MQINKDNSAFLELPSQLIPFFKLWLIFSAHFKALNSNNKLTFLFLRPPRRDRRRTLKEKEGNTIGTQTRAGSGAI